MIFKFLRFISPIGLFFLIVAAAYGQSDKGTITGHLTDSTGSVISYATIQLEGTTFGATSDAKGDFKIENVPAGSYTIIVSVVGYSPEKREIHVEAGKTTQLALKLNQEVLEMEEVLISGRGSNYVDPITSTGTRTETPLKDIPQSIQVIPQQVLKDQQVILAQEAVRNMAGVNKYGGYNDYTMRGFRATSGNHALNGQRMAGNYYNPQVTYNIEQIEVIKGPASVLYGVASPGGVINYVTKMPKYTRGYSIGLTYGSFESFRGVADATGPIGKSEKFFYRAIAGYENSGTLQDFVRNQNYYFNPSISFRPSDKTDITVIASHYRNDSKGGGWYNRGIIAPAGDYKALPINWTHHEKEDKTHDIITNVQLLARHKITDKLSIHLLSRYNHYDYLQQYHHIRWNSYDASTQMIRREFRDFHDVYNEFYNNLYASYKLKTGKVTNLILVGFDYGYQHRWDTYASSRAGVPGLHIFNPVYGQGNPANYKGEAYNEYLNSYTSYIAGYIQDQIEFSPKVKALWGLRYESYTMHSRVENRTANVNDPTKPVEIIRDTSTASSLVPRVGVVYQPIKQLSFYTSYSQSFEPQYSNMPEAGGPFDPMKGVQYEVGVKGEFYNGKIVPTVAVYQIDQINILTTDPNDPAKQIPGNEATSQGIEFSVAGSVIKNVNVVANYAYNETKITKSPNLNAANVNPWFMNAPNHTANLWAVYSFDKGLFKGFGIGGGFYAVGKQYSNFPGFSIPGYEVLDAVIKYQYKGFTTALNLYNLADKRYIASTFNVRDANFPGNPRSFRLSVGYNF